MNSPQNILDIGTGTGLIALMLAQRTTNNTVTITALDIDKDAALQAEYNVSRSPYKNQVKVKHQDILNHNLDEADFDLIVCNPPYFINDLKTPDTKRNLARHSDSLDFAQLIKVASQLSSDNATFNLILPVTEAEHFLELCKSSEWRLNKRCNVSHSKFKKPFRSLLQLKKAPGNDKVVPQNLYIREEDNSYSQDYTRLCRDFYLKM